MKDSEFFHEATIRICGTLDPDKMIEKCYSFFKNYFPLDGIGVSVLDQEKGGVEIIISHLTDSLPSFNGFIKLNKEGLDFIEKNKDGVIITRSLEDNPVTAAVNKVAGIKSVSNIVLHLKIDNERIGVFVMFSEKPDMFNEEHARLLNLLHDPLAIAISNQVRFQELLKLKNLLKEDNQYLYRELIRKSGDTIIGAESGLKDVMTMVSQVAKIDSKVLILGETGVGKEVIASSIHKASERSDKPFIKLNCGAIPENLIDSELFGHEKGAFTGAVSTKRGRFERADKGTLFLDEIGELPPDAQTRLLRVLQTGEFERVGGKEPVKADVRIISATHRDLNELVKTGKFREDLLFRINVFPIHVPPLRQRIEDIPEYVEYFINRKSIELNIPFKPEISMEAFSSLKRHNWPGNIRELENTVERELIKTIGTGSKKLYFNEFADSIRSRKVTENADEKEDSNFLVTADELFRIHVKKVMEITKGRIQGKGGAAEILGLNPSTLRNRLRKLKVPFGREK